MKPRMQKQNLLKALLLMALFANLSWGPSWSQSLNQRLNTLDLSSETLGGAPAPSAPVDAVPAPPAAAKVIDQANVNASIVSIDVDPSAAPAAPVSVAAPVAALASAHDPVPPEVPKICGQRFFVTFREIPLKDGTLTEIHIQPHTGEISGFKAITYRVNGGLDVNYDQADIKKDNDAKIESLVKSHLSSCDDDDEPVVAKHRRKDKDEKDTDREDIKTGVKECRLNSKGDALTEVQQARCHLDQLSGLSVDTDDRVAVDRMNTKVEKIVRDNLEKSIKNRLMSRDDSKIDEGEDLLQQTVDAVNDLTTEDNLDTYRMSRLVMELKSLKVGGETYRQASDLEDRVKDSKTDMNEQLTDAMKQAQANPRDPMALQRLQQVKYDIQNREKLLESEAQMDMTQGSYNEMLADSRLGYMATSDFSQFAQPFQIVNNDLASIRNLIMGPSANGVSSLGATGMFAPTIPSDFMNYRAGLSGQFQSNFGTTIPMQPVMPAVGMMNQTTARYTGMPTASLMTQVNPNTTFVPQTAPQAYRQIRN